MLDFATQLVSSAVLMIGVAAALDMYTKWTRR
jgi:hypothetical protein